MFNRFEKVAVVVMALLAASVCVAGAKFLVPETQTVSVLRTTFQSKDASHLRQEFVGFLLEEGGFELECSSNLDEIVDIDVVACNEGRAIGSIIYHIDFGESKIRTAYPSGRVFSSPQILLEVQVPKTKQQGFEEALVDAMAAANSK